MTNGNLRIVQPNPEGRWDVTVPDADPVSGHFDTQAQAEKRAKEIVKNAGGGEVQIRRRDGRIRDSDTVPNGNESKRCDTKH